MRFDDLKQLRFGCGSCIEDYMLIYGIVQHLRCKKIIEIGSNMGCGAITAALAMKENDSPPLNAHVYTFDIGNQYQDICLDQAKKLNVEHMITPILGDSDKVKQLQIKHFDLGIIDGDHTLEGVRKDYENLRYLCDYLLFHDVHSCQGSKDQYEELVVEKCGFFNRPPGHIWCDGKLDKPHTCFQGWAIVKGDYNGSR